MGAPPSEDAIAQMMDDPNIRQTMNEALNNPDLVNMMIQNTPMLRDMPNAREMLQSPMFRDMLTNPDAIRQAAAMRRQLGGGGAGGFPAPGVTDTTPAGAAGSIPANNQGNAQPFNLFSMPPGAGPGAAGNPFASLFGGPSAAAASGQTPAQTPQTAASAGGTPSAGTGTNPPNPFASMIGGPGAVPGAGLFAGMPQPTPEQIQQAMEMMRNGSFGDMFGPGGFVGLGGMGGAGAGTGASASAAAAAPEDTRPPEERYADQLRQLNDMGFFDFDRNVAALRRSGGSVQGAIEQLLS